MKRDLTNEEVILAQEIASRIENMFHAEYEAPPMILYAATMIIQQEYKKEFGINSAIISEVE